MKLLNVKLIMLLMLAATLVFTSCKDDEDKKLNPTITVDALSSPESTTLKPGDPITIKFSATKGPDGKKLNEVRLEVSQDGGTFFDVSGFPDKGTDGKGIDADNYSKNLNFNARTVQSGTDAYRITVLDKDGNSATRTLTYKIEATVPVDVTPVMFTNIALSNATGFFSTSTGKTYNNTDAEANKSLVDITYFNSPAAGDNLASASARNKTDFFGPYAITWGATNVEYKTTSMTPAQYVALVDFNNIKAVFDGGTLTEVTGNNPAGTRITAKPVDNKGGQFKAGAVIAFKTSVGNKHGLILINSAASSESGAATLSFKLEK